MIFVIMGMEVHPFDRLARAVDELARTDAVGEDFSYSSEPANSSRATPRSSASCPSGTSARTSGGPPSQ